MLRVLILYAHPVKTSFGAALHAEVVTTLRKKGHQVDDCDLYEEAFDPVLSERERLEYRNTAINRERVSSYADRVLAARAIVLVYPVWNEGFPAILKGFLDRVFIPGVSFDMGPDGALTPKLDHIQKLAAVCTYGANRLTSLMMGDPPRRVVKRMLRATLGRSVSCDYLAQYDLNRSTPKTRAAFLEKVRHTFQAW
jgi:NAD(P)H dehydrogenase (quinone)